jgi:hypothetical protein
MFIYSFIRLARQEVINYTGAAKHPAGARPSKCIIIINYISEIREKTECV